MVCVSIATIILCHDPWQQSPMNQNRSHDNLYFDITIIYIYILCTLIILTLHQADFGPQFYSGNMTMGSYI